MTGVAGANGAAGADGADGSDGVGISSTTDNSDGTFTLTYTDGTSFTTADFRGTQGVQQVQPEMGSHRQQKTATEHLRLPMMMGLHLQHQI